MTQVDSTGDSDVVRPKSLQPASLWKRAIAGLLVLFLGTFGAAWLYHVAIDVDANAAQSAVTSADRISGSN